MEDEDDATRQEEVAKRLHLRAAKIKAEKAAEASDNHRPTEKRSQE